MPAATEMSPKWLLPLALFGCGGEVAPPDGGIDAAAVDAAFDGRADIDAAAQDDCGIPVGQGPWVDSCCAGGYCNGACIASVNDSQPKCACGAADGCPSAARCCYVEPHGYECVPEQDVGTECLTCADVGKGAGIETCCPRTFGTGDTVSMYCRGVCGTNTGLDWCTCQPFGPGCYWSQLCCPLGDGGRVCVDGDAGVCP